jgi:alpha-L-fucosidase
MPENDTITKGSIIMDFKKTVSFNRIVVQEPIFLGQRIKEFDIDVWFNNAWQPLTTGTTIGYKRILRFPNTKSSKIRFTIKNALANPLVAEIGVYLAPVLLLPPQLTRDQAGTVSMSSSKGLTIFYTTDGTPPNTNSTLYSSPFNIKGRGTINAVAYDATSKKYSSVTNRSFDVCAEKFKLVKPPSTEAGMLFDDDPNTSCLVKPTAFPYELVFDLQQTYSIKGFTYMPDQANGNLGTILHYGFETSMDGKTWKKQIETSEFHNIANHPIQQEVLIETTQARFIKLVVHDLVNKNHTSIGIAEFGVLTQ